MSTQDQRGFYDYKHKSMSQFSFTMYCIRIIIKLKGDDIMATVPTQIRIDAETKKEANELFNELGMDMSGAVNIFLRQCILRGGIPFSIEIPQYSKETLDAMAEAKRISRDPDVPGYTNMDDLKKALEE